MSQKQRNYLNMKFGHKWAKKHHFDNKGDLPEYAGDKKDQQKHVLAAAQRRMKKGH